MKSKYKFVFYRNIINCKFDRESGKWSGKVYIDNYRTKQKSFFKTEREAALWVDKVLLENGKEPVNILKRKLWKYQNL